VASLPLVSYNYKLWGFGNLPLTIKEINQFLITQSVSHYRQAAALMHVLFYSRISHTLSNKCRWCGIVARLCVLWSCASSLFG